MAQYQQYQQPGKQQQQGAPPPPPVRVPRKNPYHDGISSSAQHYDLFEMIRHPNVSRDNRPPDPPPKNLHPLSKQKQIELEVEKKFQEKRSSAALPLIANVIKFLFFVLILPPYILFYRLPKLLLVDWVVALANYIDNKLKAVGATIQRFYERLKLKIEMAFLNFWELLKSTFHKKMSSHPRNDDEPLSFLAFIAEGIIGLYRLTLHPVIIGVKKGWQLAKRSYKALREFPMQLHRAVQDTVKRISRFHDRLMEWVKNSLYRLKEAIADRTIRPVSRWIDAKVEAAAALFRRGVERLKAAFQALLFALRHPIQTGKAFHNASKNGYNHVILVCRTWIDGKKRAMYNFWMRQKAWFDKKIRVPVYAQWEKVKALGEKWLKRFGAPFRWAYKIVQPYAEAFQAKIATFLKGRTERPRRWLKQKLAPFKAAYQRIKEMWLAAYDKLETKVTKRLEKMKQTARALAEPFIWAGKHLLESLKPALQPFIKMYRGFERRMNALVYRVRRIIAWTHVLARYGMELVRGTAESLFGGRPVNL